MNVSQTQLPIVALYTADEPSVIAVREYFSQNGCQVFVNKNITEEPSYTIVIGDHNFVKYILANVPLKKSKVLLWMWSETKVVSDEILKSGHKVFLSGFVSMDHAMLGDALTFFFIGKDQCFVHHSVAPVADTVLKPIPVLQMIEKVRQSDDVDTHEVPHHTEKKAHTPVVPVVDNLETRHTVHRLFDQTQESQSGKIHPIQEKKMTQVDTSETKEKISPFMRSIDQQRIKQTIADLYATPKADGSHIPKRVATYFGIFLVILCVYMSVIGIQLIVLTWHIRSLSSCATDIDTGCVRSTGKNILRDHSVLMMTGKPVLTAVSIISNEAAYDIENISQLIERVGSMADISASALDEGLVLAKNIGSSSPDDPTASPIVGVVRLKKIIESLRTRSSDTKQLMSALVHSTGPIASIPKLRALLLSADLSLERANKLLESGYNILTLAPLIGGFRTPQHYLVILQNSAELRPTGGFIGSVIKLTVDNGRITGKDVSDVYTLDGQLKGHVEPPEPIRTLLGQEHWYLRDSNWSPDFGTAAKQAAWFFQKEQGTDDPIDGVIGITTESVKKYLALSGPLDLPDIRDRITGQNFYEKAFVHTEVGFFPGSTQKRDFLASLSDGLMIRLTQGSKTDAHAAVLTLFEGLASSDITIWFPDREKQQLAEAFGWAGQIPSRTSCSEKTSKNAPCTLLTTPINEANMNVSKINTMISREDTWHIEVGTGGTLSETLTRTIKNSSDNSVHAGGYQTYLRFYIPVESTNVAVSIDGTLIERRIKSDGPVSVPYWELSDILGDKHAIGVALKVPQRSETRITVSFTHVNPLALGTDGGLIELSIPRQPGTGETKTAISIDYPSGYRPRSFQMEPSVLLANPGRLEYNTLLSEPKNIYIRLGRLYE